MDPPSSPPPSSGFDAPRARSTLTIRAPTSNPNSMECKYIGFIGCYTKPGQADPFENSHGGIPHDRCKVGKGVLAIGVDAEGRLSYLNNGDPVITSDDLPNPSYLAFYRCDENNARLCVVSEVEDGKWRSFSVQLDKSDGIRVTLEPVGTLRDTGGSYPCHIIHAPSDLILISNYGEDRGVLSLVSNNRNLDIEPDRIVFGSGSRANFNRQQTSHAHSACIVPSESSGSLDVCAVDLGSDSIIQLRLAPRCDNVSVLECKEMGRLAAPAGSGPRSCKYFWICSNSIAFMRSTDVLFHDIPK